MFTILKWLIHYSSVQDSHRNSISLVYVFFLWKKRTHSRAIRRSRVPLRDWNAGCHVVDLTRCAARRVGRRPAREERERIACALQPGSRRRGITRAAAHSLGGGEGEENTRERERRRGSPGWWWRGGGTQGRGEPLFFFYSPRCASASAIRCCADIVTGFYFIFFEVETEGAHEIWVGRDEFWSLCFFLTITRLHWWRDWINDAYKYSISRLFTFFAYTYVRGAAVRMCLAHDHV